jgi:cysteine desulfurase / selenocysteine lyase
MASAPPTTLPDVRSDFPVLSREWNGQRVTYVDSAATSQKPNQVLVAMDRFLRESNASVHRGLYDLGREATNLFEGARERIARFVGGDAETTIFTHNATEAINLVAYAWARDNLHEGDEVLVTRMEHHSNIVPWQLACQDTGARLRYLDISDDGFISLDELDAVLAEGRVKLVGVVHVSNVLGTINPVAEVVARAHAAGAVVVVDGTQAVPQMPVDVGEIGADFYAWTGHKALGPTGVGVLHGRRELLTSMRPYVSGGHMISRVDDEMSTWSELPHKFEAGTSAIADAIGLGAAIDYLTTLGMDAVRAHEESLTAYALERLQEVPGLTIFGPAEASARGGVVSFSMVGIHPHDIAEVCDRHAVCIRAGHHCTQPLMRRLGVGSTGRASFHVYNHPDDVDRLVDALHDARRVFEL